MPSEQNTDREALGDIIDDWLTDPDHIDTGFLADAILNSEWLADLIRRERGVGWAEWHAGPESRSRERRSA